MITTGTIVSTRPGVSPALLAAPVLRVEELSKPRATLVYLKDPLDGSELLYGSEELVVEHG